MTVAPSFICRGAGISAFSMAGSCGAELVCGAGVCAKAVAVARTPSAIVTIRVIAALQKNPRAKRLHDRRKTRAIGVRLRSDLADRAAGRGLLLRQRFVDLVGNWLEPLHLALVDRQLQRVAVGRGAVPVLDAGFGPPRLAGEHLAQRPAALLRP